MQKIKTLAIAFALSCSAAFAEEPVKLKELTTINNQARLTALIHTEREKRARKFLWLVPGKIVSWHYEYVMPDGSTATKIEFHEIKGVYDRRPLRESHPNIAIAIPLGQAAGAMAGPSVARIF